MLWLAVHLSDLGLEQWQRDDPESHGRPAVLVDEQRIVMMNAAAHEARIQIGSRLALAQSLAPDVVFYSRDHSAERNHLQFLASEMHQFSSFVSRSEPDALLLEIQGSLRLFGGVHLLKTLPLQWLRSLGHEACLGVAHTPYAALALAKAQCDVPLPNYPDEGEVVRSVTEHLADVELTHTELEPKDRERLSNMGIFTVGQLVALPRHELGQRFRPAVLEYLAKLTGLQPDPRTPQKPVEQFRSAVHLLEPIKDKTSLELPMRHLATALSAWLEKQDLGVTQMLWDFRPFRGQGCEMPVRFARPRVNAEAILKTAMVALEKADLPDEVMSVALCAADVDALSRGHAVEPDLLGVQGRQAPIGGLFDRLIARLGERALNFLGTEDDHRPERAWSARPVTAPSKQQAPSAAECLFRGPRPLWLLAQPVPVRSAYFEIVSGPERIESGWWEEQHSVRDYYIARHGNGGYCWLYHNEQGWFQHGYFS